MASATETVITASIALEIFIVEVVMFSVAALSWILRLCFKYRRRDNIGLDDVLATLSLLVLAAIEGLIWHYKYAHIPDSNASDGSSNVEYLSRSGTYMILYWSATATSQMSILWFYRYVCSGFSWAKALLTFSIAITLCGWAAFTVCDSLNLAFMDAYSKQTMSAPLLTGYDTFETASMILEPLCWFLILCIQGFRLNHIRDKILDKPWLIFVPCSTVLVIVTGALRLYYFRQSDMVSERIWLQVHLGTAMLSCSMPVYTGLENMCCMSDPKRQASVEIWLHNIQANATNAQEASSVVEDSPIDKEFCWQTEPDIESLPSQSRPNTRRPSQSSTWINSSRRPSIASTRHGHTREIVVEPEEILTQRDGAQFIPSRRSSKAERATKRLIIEG